MQFSRADIQHHHSIGIRAVGHPRTMHPHQFVREYMDAKGQHVARGLRVQPNSIIAFMAGQPKRTPMCRHEGEVGLEVLRDGGIKGS